MNPEEEVNMIKYPSLYRLNSWEENGYHDSDFCLAVWDAERRIVRGITYASTAYAGGDGPSAYPLPTPEIVEEARLYLVERIYEGIRAAEHRDVFEPGKIEEGQRVILLEDHRNMAKNIETCACEKCNGTGKWVNPRRPEDQRECFACHGKGQRFVNATRAKDGDGKQVWQEFKTGVAGEVKWAGTFRQIFAKGYNKLDRSTLSCVVKLDDGREMRVPLAKLRLEREPMSDEELRERAVNLSFNYRFMPLCTRHGGWLSENYAADVAAKAKDQPKELVAASQPCESISGR